jgi:hypothetical protein
LKIVVNGGNQRFRDEGNKTQEIKGFLREGSLQYSCHYDDLARQVERWNY